LKVYGRWVLSGLLCVSAVAAAQSARNLALVNGEAITEADVYRAAGGALRQLEENHPQSDAKYEREKLAIRWRALNSLMERKLVRAEAAKLMISEEELLESEVDNYLQDIPDPIVEAFFEANKRRMPLTLRLPRQEALTQVRAYMGQQAYRMQRDSYVERLAKKYAVTTYLEPLRADIGTAGHPARGPEKAPVTIAEFSDFECPFCAAMIRTLDAVQRQYGDKVRIVYRQFPLTYLHTHSQKAAEASLCAHEQMKFWEFHDAMFANQRDLTVDALKRKAASLNLDAQAFNQCLDSSKHADAVRKELDEGYEAGVQGTPTIFINGRMLFGNRDVADIRRVVDDELRRAQAQ
jgi:predicted DsbA family dithiol-disulfide isomerase